MAFRTLTAASVLALSIGLSGGAFAQDQLATALLLQASYADTVQAPLDDSDRLIQLRQSSAVDPQMVAQRDALAARSEELKIALKDKALPKDQKKALSTEKKTVDKELKGLEKTIKNADSGRRKEIAKLEKALVKTYGKGPYPAEVRAYQASKPEALRGLYASLFIEGERNAVLNFTRLGIAALETGYLDHAEWALDQAIDRIEVIYSDNPEAKQARSVFSAESVKDFKGEPYERAMAYYYRGIVYLAKGDFENASAVFKAGEYQDTISESEEFQSDFAALNYLAGWSTHCQQRSGTDSFVAASVANPALSAPAADANTLWIAEMGTAPTKFGEGQYSEYLKFSPAIDPGAAGVVVSDASGASVVPLIAASDVYFQATTRGGRPVDSILAGKAQFKDTTAAIGEGMNTLGTTAMMTGALTGDTDMLGVGGAMALVGMFSGALSAAATPAADTRSLDNLPSTIALNASRSTPESLQATSYHYQDAAGTTLLSGAPLLVGGNDQCHVAWSRDRSALGIAESAPSARLSWQEMKRRPEAQQVRDVAFRTALVQDGINLPAEETTAR